MAVPLLDLTAQHAALAGELREMFDRLVQSGRFILGPAVEQFERSLAEHCQARFAVGMSSGTDALLAALMAMEIGPGDEVVTTPFTFFATAGSIARVGATPVFVDIDPATFNIDPAKVEPAITPRTRAIMPVHLFGQSADMAPLLELARKHKLRIIEDAAQAIDARDTIDGEPRPVGAIGDVGCLSFYPSKNLAAMGDAGACLTNDQALATRLRVLRAHGETARYHHQFLGGNFRLDAVQAAVLSIKLSHLPKWAEARRAHARLYAGLLAGLPVKPPCERPGKFHTFNQFTIRVPDGRRDALREHLRQRGIGHEVYYPRPLHLQPCFARLGGREGQFPQTERAAGEVLSLPVFPELSEAQQREVAQAVGEFFR